MAFPIAQLQRPAETESKPKTATEMSWKFSPMLDLGLPFVRGKRRPLRNGVVFANIGCTLPPLEVFTKGSRGAREHASLDLD
jgi:hypothetical protein